MSNSTSSIKIYENRNSTYKKGDILIFNIPSSVLAINSLETRLCMQFEITSELANAYCLNHQIGAEALVKSLTVYDGTGQVVIEQIQNYNHIRRVLAYYNNNTTMDHLCQLNSGGQPVAPILKNNQLFDKGTNGSITQKKTEVAFSLNLSGIFNSNKPFPSFLTSGLQLRITLEDDVNKVLQRMSGYTVPRIGDSADWLPTNLKDYFERPVGTNPTMCYQVKAWSPSTANATSCTLMSKAADGGDYNKLIKNQTRNGDANVNYNHYMTNYPTAGGTVENFTFAIGQKITFFNADQSGGVEGLTISAIENDGDRIKITWEEGATNMTPANSDGGGYTTAGCCLFEVGNSVLPGATTINPTTTKSDFTISEVFIDLGTINLDTKEISSLESQVNSKGGWGYDLTTFTDFPVNISKALLNSVYIPAKLQRSKSIITFWEDVNNYVDASRDNLLPVVDSNTEPSEYVYKLANLLVPNRKVSLSEYNAEPSKGGRWAAVHLSEMEKGIEAADRSVRSLADIKRCLLVCRNLARYGHTYNLLEQQAETRVELSFSKNNRTLLIHNVIPHKRRVVITPTSRFIEM